MSVEIRIYNPSLQLQGVIDEFSSLIWIRRYQEPGEFELRTPYAAESKQLLIPENIVQRFDGRETVDAGVVENIFMTSDEIIIKGRFLESYLDRRLIKETTYYTGNAEDSMRSIISNMETIPLLSLGTDYGLTETLIFQATYKSVLNIISKACRATGLGFRIRPDFSTRDLYFEVYKGADRTSSNAAKVIFSEKYDNLMNEQYSYDSTSYKTKAFVSQLIDNVRVAYNIGGGTGLGLREVHVPTTVDVNGKTSAEIEASMKNQGQRALDSKIIWESFTFATDAESPFRYRSDYDVGDLVHVKHTAWNIDLALRISEIEEDYKDGGRDIVVTCGSPLPEIMDFEEG
jgi:hypothetical protein